MADMELKKDENGNDVMVPDDFRLHVATGKEAEQQWPSVSVPKEVMPLLDLPEAWRMIVEEKQLPSKKKIKGELLEANAKIMIKEFSYHMLASTALPPKEEEDNAGEESNEKAEGETDEKKEEDSKSDEAADKAGEDGKPSEAAFVDPDALVGKSIYGASLLLKIQWEDKNPQKAVPHRSYKELGEFVCQFTTDLRDAMEKNQKAGQAVLDCLAFERSLLLLARYMEGIETGEKGLEASVYELLTLCAERANPKEMCMPLRVFAKKIDHVYIEPSAYLMLEPLLKIWTKLVLRIPRKRHYFLHDLIRGTERLLDHAESYELSYVDEDSVGVPKPGRISDVTDILLEFFEELTKLQLKQWETSETIRLHVDELGRLKPEALDAAREQNKEGKPGTNGTSGKEEDSTATESNSAKEENAEEGGKKDGSSDNQNSDADAIDEETKDWAEERASTLAKVLNMQGTIWNELKPPVGEERDSPYRKSKSVKKRALQSSMVAEKTEYTLVRFHRLFKNLGWSNPVLVCQMASGELNLDPWNRVEQLFRAHIRHESHSKKRNRSKSYSLISVALYVCGALRPMTRRLLEGQSVDNLDEYAVDLNGTGFDLLDPFYALDLALPYLMTVMADATPTRSLASILVTWAFLKRIPDSGYETFDDVLRIRFSINATGREVNLVGLSQHLMKAVAGCDDPRHRRVSYETFQMVLRKIRDPHARYTVIECVFHECKRVAVAAQLVTEMKDALRYSDSLAEEEKSTWSEAQASDLKTRFAQVVLPHYFTPRKEMLMSVNAIVSVAGAVVWLAGSDKRLLQRLPDGSKIRGTAQKRISFVKAYSKLGRECVRSLATVAEHDRKVMPKSKLAKRNMSEAKALYTASGRALNNCMSALSLLSLAEQLFE